MRRNNKQVTTYFILFSLLLIGVVYAILQANLQINGTAKIQANTWDIHFDNIVVNENSVSIGTGDSAATIDPNNNCKVDFEVTLSVPGDFYEFTIDVVNAGTIDGMIGELNKTLKVNNEVVQETPDFLEYSITYSDGMEILENHKLEVGGTETFKVRLEFKTDIEELPEATIIRTSLEPLYIQADSNAMKKLSFFEGASWNQIVEAYNSNDRSILQSEMELGTRRAVQLDMNYDGTPETVAYLRIANLSTPVECSEEGFSQTACGFVIEFANILSQYFMNPKRNNGSTVGDGNNGGWEHTYMRANLNSSIYLEGQSGSYSYVSEGIYNMLPNDLKNIIINTTVVSGHGLNDLSNITTIDKLYLLSTHEVWEYSSAGIAKINETDTSYYNTRQLDYYYSKNVTTFSSGAAKKYKLDGSISSWWLRSAHVNTADSYFMVYQYGSCNSLGSSASYGVSPAFRIAK